ncbi:MAG TPA: phosphatidate cytidylyltransferase [Burkholderiaceae bacterium]|nr:phosphatidate cytidylyltransferase [Burkholderiaceae bacterium]
MLRQRIATALVLLAVLGLSLAAADPIWFHVLVAAFISVAAWEWYRLLGVSLGIGTFSALAVSGLGFAASLIISPVLQPWLFGLACVAWAIIALPALHTSDWVRRVRILQLALPLIMLTACLTAVFALLAELGSWGLLSLLAIVWLADVGAYFAGRAFGRRKLALTISPNKTIEGALGGLLAVALYVVAIAKIYPGLKLYPSVLSATWGMLATLGLLVLLAALSITGDLFESLLKRRAGFKDSSQLLPGHGGVLDRIDALVPVLPVAGLMLMMASR